MLYDYERRRQAVPGTRLAWAVWEDEPNFQTGSKEGDDGFQVGFSVLLDWEAYVNFLQ